MRQILDFFDLLSAAGGGDADTISWRLVRISMQNPLQATAEAFSHIPGVAPEPIARKEKEQLASSIEQITIAHRVPEWMDDASRAKARDFFARNANGIGRTDIVFDEGQPTKVIVDSTARAALAALKSEPELPPEIELSRTEAGSIEGYVTQLTTHYHRPAATVRERRTGNYVLCVLSDELAEKIGHQHDWSEIWTGRRVVVPGKITYRRDGTITRVFAKDIHVIESHSISYEDIIDANFTPGLSPADYLGRLREGDVE